MKKRNIFLLGLLVILLAMGLVLAGCGDDGSGDNGSGGSGSGDGGYKWDSWRTIVLPSGTSGAQFMLDDQAPHEIEVQIQGGTPTSFTLSSYASKHVTTPQAGGTLQYRYRMSGFGIQASTISGPVVRFQWLGEFAAQK